VVLEDHVRARREAQVRAVDATPRARRPSISSSSLTGRRRRRCRSR
jgi:hypothetical protein